MGRVYKLDNYNEHGYPNFSVNNKPPTVEIKTNSGFLRRLWFLITNPFLYLFKGIVRY